MRTRILGACMAGMFACGLIGCVSTSKYRKAQNEAAEYKTQLEQAQLEAENLKKANEELAMQSEALQQASEQTKNQYQDVVNQLQQEVEQGQVSVTTYKNMLRVDVAEKIFFDSGSATLKQSGQEVLQHVGEALAPLADKIIRVVGHTDNVPIQGSLKAKFPSNWELSVARAANVVRFLQDKSKIDPARLVAVGRGEHDPIAPNDTPENRQKNRRIEITLMDKNLLATMEQAK